MNRAASTQHIDEVLRYLPGRPEHRVAKGTVVYAGPNLPTCLYLVGSGYVKVATGGGDGGHPVVRIVPPRGLFGECAVIGGASGEHAEEAVALTQASLAEWTVEEVEERIERYPRLGMLLTQNMVARCVELQERIESMAVRRTPERVAIALLQLGEGLGEAAANGYVRVPGLTHQVIAEYVGTSREVVTFQMNRLRRLGLLAYTRQHIDVAVEAMLAHLRERGVPAARNQTVTPDFQSP